MAAAVADATRPAAVARRRFRPDIQGLRAVAVILVVGNHAHVWGFGGGYAGVDVFFVVSGYVITQRLLADAGRGIGRGLAGFYARRVRRIVPAASAALVGTLVAARVLLGSRFDPALLGDVRWSALFGANVRLISTGSDYFVPGVAPSLVTQFWSLAVEEQFYLLFPLLVFVTARFARDRLRLLMFTTLSLVALSAWWSAYTSAAHPAVAYYSPFTRFWELGVGCLLAMVPLALPPQAQRVSARLGAGGLLLTLVLLPGATVYPGTLAWLPVASAALLLAGLARLLGARPLRWVGDRSYAIYLWHWVWLQLPAQLATPLTGPGWRLLELAGAVLTAAVTYRWLEDPVRRSRQLARDPVACALLLVVCLAAVLTTTLLVGRLS